MFEDRFTGPDINSAQSIYENQKEPKDSVFVIDSLASLCGDEDETKHKKKKVKKKIIRSNHKHMYEDCLLKAEDNTCY